MAVSCPVCRVGVADLSAHLELHTKQEVVVALLTQRQSARAPDERGGSEPLAAAQLASNPRQQASIPTGAPAALHIRKTFNNVSIVNSFNAPSNNSQLTGICLPAANAGNSTIVSVGQQAGDHVSAAAPTTSLIIPSPAAMPIGGGLPLNLLCTGAAGGGGASFFPISLLSGIATSTPLLLPQVNGPTLLVNVPTNYVAYHHHQQQQPQQQTAAASGGAAAIVLPAAGGMFASPFTVVSNSGGGGINNVGSLVVSPPLSESVGAAARPDSDQRLDNNISTRHVAGRVSSSPRQEGDQRAKDTPRTGREEFNDKTENSEADSAGPSLLPRPGTSRSAAAAAATISHTDEQAEAAEVSAVRAAAAASSPPPPHENGGAHHAQVVPQPEARHHSVISRPEVLLLSSASSSQIATGTTTQQRRRQSETSTHPSSLPFSPAGLATTVVSTSSSTNVLQLSDAGPSSGSYRGAVGTSSVIVSPGWAPGGSHHQPAAAAGNPANTTTVRSGINYIPV
jgi:hypothetical protein